MSRPESLLIVEDDERFSDTLATEFRERGYSVDSVADLQELRSLPSGQHRYAIVDLRLRSDSGLDAISLILERSPSARIVVLTGYGSIASAVRAVKLGAFNYLTKPVDFDDLEHAFQHEAEVPVGEEALQAQTLAKHEREYIEYVLNECDGNITRAARRLGLHRQSLQRKLRKFPPRW